MCVQLDFLLQRLPDPFLAGAMGLAWVCVRRCAGVVAAIGRRSLNCLVFTQLRRPMSCVSVSSRCRRAAKVSAQNVARALAARADRRAGGRARRRQNMATALVCARRAAWVDFRLQGRLCLGTFGAPPKTGDGHELAGERASGQANRREGPTRPAPDTRKYRAARVGRIGFRAPPPPPPPACLPENPNLLARRARSAHKR